MLSDNEASPKRKVKEVIDVLPLSVPKESA